MRYTDVQLRRDEKISSWDFGPNTSKTALFQVLIWLDNLFVSSMLEVSTLISQSGPMMEKKSEEGMRVCGVQYRELSCGDKRHSSWCPMLSVQIRGLL
jgi:hypothetical protein